VTLRLTAIHQFLPTLADRDAIGLHVLEVQRLVQSMGLESEIFSEDIHAEMRGKARPFELLAGSSDPATTALLYHASTGCRNFDLLAAWEGKLFVDYHNITEPAFFERWSPGAADNMRLGRRQLGQLARRCDLAMAHSHFSAEELTRVGYPTPVVVPIIVDFSRYDVPADRRTLARLKKQRAAGGSQWLYVGRVSPNKCHHDLVGAFAIYRAVYDPQARLTLVGGATSESYWQSLEALCRELELRGSVWLADTVSFGQLLAHYRTADVLVSMSEHEGFGVPLLEAMHLGIPVVAFASTAVPETVGDAALLLETKDPVAVAVAVRRVLDDEALRSRLLKSGHARVEELSLAHSRAAMAGALRTFIDADA
jgi:glycosyltransferase involved in cell wall biosynthesis